LLTFEGEGDGILFSLRYMVIFSYETIFGYADRWMATLDSEVAG